MSKSFYDETTKLVKELILINKKLIQIELKESKELVKLIRISTTRDLTKDEQNKVKQQLLDVFKVIPSLAIFMLPGGAILLPIVLKFIPSLLPSAFGEDVVEDK